MNVYADGCRVSPRRQQKAGVLAEILPHLLPDSRGLRLVDFGCADGALPVLLLRSSAGAAVERITGITLLDYNDLYEKRSHAHPRFERVVADLEGSLDHLDLPWGRCDLVTATAFFHYLHRPKVAFGHAARLLKAGGYLAAGMPAAWVLRLRRAGLPAILPRNRKIRQIQSLDAWGCLANSCGFVEVSREAIQWFGASHTAALERWLWRRRWLHGIGGNYLAIYRKA